MVTSDASVISRGLDMGLTYFDTARGYGGGNNERMVGACLKGSRQKIVLSSKSRGKTPAEAMEHLETSLRELATDYLDIWYMHYRDEPGRHYRRPDRDLAQGQTAGQDPARRREHAPA